MNGPAAANERAARTLHAALLVGTLAITAVLVGVRASQPDLVAPLEGGVRTVFRAVVLLLVVGATLGLRVIRGSLPPVSAPEARDAWWGAIRGRASAIWAVAEGVGVAGGVLYFVTGDLLLLMVSLGWALAMLLWHSPTRLVE